MGTFELIMLRYLRDKYPQYPPVLLHQLARLAPSLLVTSAVLLDPARFIEMVSDVVRQCVDRRGLAG